jgi:hypothetical protein
VNGEVVKQEGTQARIWKAGVPPLWSAYTDLDPIANPAPPRTFYMAVPVPRRLVQTSPVTVEIRQSGHPLELRGDYFDSPNSPYVGPMLDPWNEGTSFWRWQWNGTDPRIPWSQSFGPRNYRSSYLVPDQGVSGRSEETWHDTPGSIYRIFLAWEPFGPRTNALLPLVPGGPGIAPACPVGRLLAGTDPVLPFICTDESRIYFYASGGVEIVTLDLPAFSTPFTRNTLISRHVTSRGRVEVVGVIHGRAPGVTNKLFVARMFDTSGELLYSGAFWLTLP